MIPFADFTYFGLLLYLVVPAMLLGLLGRIGWAGRAWMIVSTVVVLVVQYRVYLGAGPLASVREIWLLAGFLAYSAAVIAGFAWLRRRTRRPWTTWLAVLLALLPLLVGKVAPVLAPGSIAGFLGLSYMTFRALDVVFGIHDGLFGTIRPLSLLTYLAWFPTILAGPIDRYHRFLADWKHDRTRAETLQDLDAGLHRIMTGFLYSFILAALIKRYWLEPAAAGSGLLDTISYMYAYSLFLFFDFAGYSAFAIGVSYLFGVHPPENFRRPFLARDIRDFWERWHISLSSWLRDHVYMRFVLAARRGRWFAGRNTASYLGIALAFGLMGVWHGLEPHYILYGVYHAGLLIGYDIFARWNKTHQVWGNGPVWRVAGVVLTVQAACFGFLIFSGRLGPFLGTLLQ